MALTSLFIASLLGSLHCAAMCGGFSTYCAAHSKHSAIGQIYYNLGRLVTYCILGGIAGFLGSVLDIGGDEFGIHRISSLVTGFVLIFWGLRSLLRRDAEDLITLSPSSAKGFYKKLLLPNENANWNLRSFFIGNLSGALPCGWLYSFVALAAGSGSMQRGIVTMAVFWLGTVPILTVVGSLFSHLAKKFGKHLPTVTALLILLAGLFSLLGHLFPESVMPFIMMGAEDGAGGHHHH